MYTASRLVHEVCWRQKKFSIDIADFFFYICIINLILALVLFKTLALVLECKNKFIRQWSNSIKQRYSIQVETSMRRVGTWVGNSLFLSLVIFSVVRTIITLTFEKSTSPLGWAKSLNPIFKRGMKLNCRIHSLPIFAYSTWFDEMISSSLLAWSNCVNFQCVDQKVILCSWSDQV